MLDFNKRIEDLDADLFARINSQTTPEDKTSLLACQLAVRKLRGGLTLILRSGRILAEAFSLIYWMSSVNLYIPLISVRSANRTHAGSIGHM